MKRDGGEDDEIEKELRTLSQVRAVSLGQKKLRRPTAPPHKSGSENIRTPHPEHQTQNKEELLTLIESHFDGLLAAISHDNQRDLANFLLIFARSIHQAIQIRRRIDALPIDGNDAITSLDA